LKFLLLAGGRAASAPETVTATDYLKRAALAGKKIGLKDAGLVEIDERKANWLEALPKGGVLAALDERGTNASSTELAAWLRKHLDSGIPALALAIGAADGLPTPVKAAARETFAFGRATWPHMMVRVMAAEQIYRAVTILVKHPYHRI